MIYRSARLAAEHQTSTFDCANDSLNSWLQTEALRAERAGICATTVWTQTDETQVMAFHSIAPTVVTRELPIPRKMTGGHSAVPGYLLGRLALDRGLHGRRLGSQLLLDALEVMVHAAGRAGGRVIIVDAIDEAAIAFYEHHDFTRIQNSTRLVMKIATARRAIS